MLGTHDDTMRSKTGACVLFLDVIPLWRWIVLCRCYAFQPDGDLGSLGQSVPGALQPRVDLSHLNDPFQSHYLQALVANICGASTRTHHSGPNASITATCMKRRVKTSRDLTLWDCFEKVGVSDDPTLLHLWQTVRFLGFTPEVGAAVHAGYVEDGYALQTHVAELQGSPAALTETTGGVTGEKS